MSEAPSNKFSFTNSTSAELWVTPPDGPGSLALIPQGQAATGTQIGIYEFRISDTPVAVFDFEQPGQVHIDFKDFIQGPPVLKLKNNSLNQTSFTVLRPNQPASRGRVVDETHPGTYVVMMGNFISITIVFRGTYPIDVDIV